MGGRGSKSPETKAKEQKDKEYQNIYKKKLEGQGYTNLKTSVGKSTSTDVTFFRQGFRDTSFRLRKTNDGVQLIRYALGESTPEILGKNTKETNDYMREHGLIFRQE